MSAALSPLPTHDLPAVDCRRSRVHTLAALAV